MNVCGAHLGGGHVLFFRFLQRWLYRKGKQTAGRRSFAADVCLIDTGNDLQLVSVSVVQEEVTAAFTKSEGNAVVSMAQQRFNELDWDKNGKQLYKLTGHVVIVYPALQQ